MLFRSGNFGTVSNGIAADLTGSGGLSASEIANAADKAVKSGDASPGLFSNVSDWWSNLPMSKKLLYGGAGILGVSALTTPKYNMPVFGKPNYPQFGLASNYQRTPNPTPVYAVARGGVVGVARIGLGCLRCCAKSHWEKNRGSYRDCCRCRR